MKIKTAVQPQPVRTSYTPLKASFGIVIDGGGSKTQFYYTNANTYIPNRTITPMKLRSFLNIADPDGIISNGDKSSQLTVTWYEGSEATQITDSNSGYTLNADGTLLVKKNVTPSAPVQLICRATFTDTRNGNTLVYYDTFTLNTIQKSDDQLSLSINQPAKITYNPLKDSQYIDITAVLKMGSETVADANVAYWWYKVENGEETLINSSDLNIEYVSGQGTKTLCVDADNTYLSIIRCRAAYYTGTKPSAPTDDTLMAETVIVYKIPPIKAFVYSPNGNTIRKGVNNMIFYVKILTNKEELTTEQINKFFFVKWFKKSSAAGATATEIGHGNSISVTADSLRLSGGLQMSVYPEVYEIGPYTVLTTKSGDPIRTGANEVIIARG
ncbi:hypothetical protein [Bacteroides cellulosilyticus]|jgi:hypothetical protein|uniref:hypothetical protein n=1 Tax=Bacteroides cellulosilyticus TaxID=246787 RepID=UPI0020612BBD|nr:MAG TPA: hypothetical protein [Caudoviricetes sp.]